MANHIGSTLESLFEELGDLEEVKPVGVDLEASTRKALANALEKHGANYRGYCAIRAEKAISEEEYTSEIARLMAEFKSLFNATPTDEAANLEAWITLCLGQTHVPSLVIRNRRFNL